MSDSEEAHGHYELSHNRPHDSKNKAHALVPGYASRLLGLCTMKFPRVDYYSVYRFDDLIFVEQLKLRYISLTVLN